MIGLRIGTGQRGPAAISGRYANRHALVAGATGTGKTTTLATLAESFSVAGVPVLALDVKGDLEGLARANPVEILDPFGAAQLEVWRLGPDLIARALDLSEAQSGALDVAFAVAEARGLPLSTLADLRALLGLVASNAKQISETVGLVSPSSVGAIQRGALRLERDAAGVFGDRFLDIGELERHDPAGRGIISVLRCDHLTRTPGLYGALCAFLLSDLFARLPEVGDLDAPRLALILDESHLIFDGAPAPLVCRLEAIVRLIRSKGVALIFATQSPADLPAAIAGQLQNRIQHGLRGVTPADQRGIRAAADSLPRAPGLNAAAVIGSLGVGRALVSVVGRDGVPQPVDLVTVRPSNARLGPLVESEPGYLPPEPKVAPVVAQAVTAPAPAAQPVKRGPPSPMQILVWGSVAVLAFWMVCALL